MGVSLNLREALTKIDPSDPTTKLLFLGDYVDRGPDSAGVVAAVKEVCGARPGQVVALADTQETWFVYWIDSDDTDPTWLLADLGLKTVRSFLPADVLEEVAAALAEAIEGGASTSASPAR